MAELSGGFFPTSSYSGTPRMGFPTPSYLCPKKFPQPPLISDSKWSQHAIPMAADLSFHAAVYRTLPRWSPLVTTTWNMRPEALRCTQSRSQYRVPPSPRVAIGGIRRLQLSRLTAPPSCADGKLFATATKLIFLCKKKLPHRPLIMGHAGWIFQPPQIFSDSFLPYPPLFLTSSGRLFT